MSTEFSAIAPKSLFEDHFISDDGITRIEAKGLKESQSSKKYILYYTLSNTIQIASFIALLKALETNDIRFAYCDCDGYDNEGFRYYCRLDEIDKLKNLSDRIEDFDAVFCTRDTLLYQFSITASINCSSLFYSVKLADFGKPIRP